METAEILRRLYGVRTSKRRRPFRAALELRRRVVRWVRRHNWSLTLIALGVGLWTLTHIYYYNNLISLQFDVEAARAQIEATEQKRSHIQRNVVSLLRFYEDYERRLTTDITELRAHADNPPPDAPGDEPLGALIGRLNAVAEAYPALRLTEIVQRFVEAVVSIESEIAIRIAQYNTAVNVYTTVMRQFPGLLFARSLGLEEPSFWKPEEPEHLRYRELTL
jgi:LemA protein